VEGRRGRGGGGGNKPAVIDPSPAGVGEVANMVNEVEVVKVVGVVRLADGRLTAVMSYPELASAIIFLVVYALRRRIWWRWQAW